MFKWRPNFKAADVYETLATIVIVWIASCLVYGILLLIFGRESICHFRCFSTLFTIFGTLYTRVSLEVRRLKKAKE
jgi:hypothetical protein